MYNAALHFLCFIHTDVHRNQYQESQWDLDQVVDLG